MLVHTLTSPRVIILEEGGFALRLEGQSASLAGVHASFRPTKACSDLSQSTARMLAERQHDSREILGCMGVCEVDKGIYLLCIAAAENMGGDLDPKQTEFLAQHVYKVKEVLFFRLDQGAVGAEDVQDHAHPCHDMYAILTAGTIYYSGSPAFDLTSRLIKRFEDLNTRVGACEPGARRSGPPYDTFEAPHGGHPFDVRFLWNSNILQPLYTIREKFSPHEKTAFDLHGFCVPVIQGFFAFTRIGDAELTVVSRRGWQGAGTRFNRRGVDSLGHVGNFAETETILTTSTESCSFVQVRGSVPCYWKEVIGAGFGALKTSVRVKLPVSDSYPAFQTHFRRLCNHYGDTVYGLNLLSASVQKEIALADAYHHLHQLAVHQDGILWDALKLIDFDMKTRGATEGLANMPHELAELVEDVLPDIGSSIITRGKGGEWVTATSKQKGIVRVNCRDCLDRTNLAQNVISWKALEMYLTTRKACCKSIDMQQLERRHQAMWARNGDALSEIYAGSAAMTSEAKTSMIAITRIEQARKRDSAKERATELLTGTALNLRPVVFSFGALK